MNNISIYSINKRLHIWKAGQSERLSVFYFVVFSWYMYLSVRQEHRHFLFGTGKPDSERKTGWQKKRNITYQ